MVVTMTGNAGDAYILGPGEGRAIDLGGFSMTVKASEATTSAMFSLLEADEPPHFGPPLHIHTGIAEAFYVLEGEYNIFIGDSKTRCPAGSFIFIPPDTEHGFQVGDVPSRKLNFYLPAAMVGYFDELSSAIRGDVAEPELLSQIATRYAMEVTGPIPDGYV
jgi:mannose-6-phosphate isomerase-like protein (cupin superfamily)